MSKYKEFLDLCEKVAPVPWHSHFDEVYDKGSGFDHKYLDEPILRANYYHRMNKQDRRCLIKGIALAPELARIAIAAEEWFEHLMEIQQTEPESMVVESILQGKGPGDV